MDQAELMARVNMARESGDPVTSLWKTILEVLAWLQEQLAIPGICERKEEIIRLCDMAIDAAAAINLPQVPDVIEIVLDQIVVSVAKAAVRRQIKRICGSV